MWRSRSYRWPNIDILNWFIRYEKIRVCLTESVFSTGFHCKSLRNLPRAFGCEEDCEEFGQWNQPPQTQDQHAAGPTRTQRHYCQVHIHSSWANLTKHFKRMWPDDISPHNQKKEIRNPSLHKENRSLFLKVLRSGSLWHYLQVI